MPIGSRVALFAPLPIMMSPVVVIGDKALKAAEAVVCPVPPDAIGNVPVVNADVDVAYTAPPDVNDVRPVPPLVVASVPASVTAPVVPVDGVRPVVPAEKDVTPVLVTVTAPVEPETLMPAPAASDVTPELAIVIEPAPLVIVMPPPCVSVVRVNPAPLPMSI